MTIEQAVAHLEKHGIILEYGDIAVSVESTAFEQIKHQVSALSADERQHTMRSVDRAINRVLPKVQRNTASKKKMDDFYYDMMIWHALKQQSAS